MALGAVSQGAIYATEAGSSFSVKGLLINMGIGAAAGAIGYGAGMVASKVIGKYAAGLGGKMLSKVGALTSREAQPAESSMAAFFGRMDAACAQRSLVQTTLDRFGLQFEESATSAFFRSMDAGGYAVGTRSSSTASLMQNWISKINENKASWTQLAKWGAETLGGSATLHEVGRWYAHTHAALPGYGT